MTCPSLLLLVQPVQHRWCSCCCLKQCSDTVSFSSHGFRLHSGVAVALAPECKMLETGLAAKESEKNWCKNMQNQSCFAACKFCS